MKALRLVTRLGIVSLLGSLSFSLLQAEPEAQPNKELIEDAENFYPRYLEKLTSLPADKQFAYAASLPILNNPALALFHRQLALKKEIRTGTASGLGHRHPRLSMLRTQLIELEGPAELNAIKRTQDILEGKNEPSLVQEEIRFLYQQLNAMRATGLGMNHPQIKILKKQITELEKETQEVD